MYKLSILQKLEVVTDQLIDLKRPENENDYRLMGKEGEKVGYFARDFGMGEWDWPQGVGLFGLDKLQHYYNDKRYEEYFIKWMNKQVENGLPTRNINTTVPLLTLMDIEGNEDFCKEWMTWLINELPRTEEKGFQHVTTGENKTEVKLNEGEIWLDTIFMTVLFSAKMGVKHDEKKWRDESIYQLLTHIKYLYDKKTNLFYHGWNYNNRDNFSEAFWCRGNSWFTLGLPEYLIIMKDYLDKGVYDYLLSTYQAQVNALIDYQASNGLWHTLLDDKDSYTEVSGTAAITAGILKGIRLGFLSKEKNFPVCLRAIDTILQKISNDGTVQGVSGGTPIGEKKEDYKNIIIAPMAYGQALTMILLTESLYHI
ncbi:glycoside hydrolase family 88/105 protein [Salipaludibacillus neizhouensis]|uniref:glycoside hydrolase family 88/105 protein n=1 Tax=Salipaludibacillus neizhouensis TaxID=885475 RepID=UPI001CBA6099|nr:glycoside hydrolase family 88 protein [Salipaludibacillus neizhouensis]